MLPMTDQYDLEGLAMTTTDPGAAGAHAPATATPVVSDRGLLRLAGGGTLATFALMLTLWSGEGPDHETVGAEQARAYVLDTVGSRELVLHSTALLLIAFGLTLPALWSIARRRAGDGALPGAMLIGGLMILLDWWVFGAITGLPAIVDDLGSATPEVVRGWYGLDKLQESFGDIGKAGQVLFFLGVGWTGLRGRFLHRPVAWSALALVACYAVSLGAWAVGQDGLSMVFFLAGLFGMLVWFLAAGVSLLINARRG